jgi:hypothetical protein
MHLPRLVLLQSWAASRELQVRSESAPRLAQGMHLDEKMTRLTKRQSELYRELEANERAIGDARRSCRHERDPQDPNYCLHCEGRVSVDYETR